ncbi:MAG: hypothetical protein QOE00_1312, partial [Ilumatobacteraceae bacterium]
DTINTMVSQLSSFAAEVTRVAREVGTDGKLGGQARVEGVSGTWKDLTENVNQLAGNLTTQVRSIAEVSTAVTQGDLTRSINVEAAGEVAELKDNINQMIANLRETTLKNAEQDWLKSNLARTGGLLQGQRNLEKVCELIMSELTPLVGAQHGAMFLVDSAAEDDASLSMIAGYGAAAAAGAVPRRFRLGESLVGQAAVDRRRIRIEQAPPEYLQIGSGLGRSAPADIVILPVLFEEDVLAVIELASLHGLSEVHLAFLDQFMETVGVVLNTIMVNGRTEELLEQSQLLTRELQHRSVELQQTNEELAEKARLLELRNRDIEVKNQEIESAQVALQDRAEQLALSSKYKSEFLANMSHELRTPLNSLLILARLLAEDAEGALPPKQVDYARTIHAAGTDLLTLISDILDLSKVEAGKMDLHPAEVPVGAVIGDLSQTFATTAEQKGLDFEIVIAQDAATRLHTDEQRLQQVLRNLLSNALKFTERGGVRLTVSRPDAAVSFTSPHLLHSDVIAFTVADTGVGVPADKLRLIFEAFQQADGTTSRRFGGTGLGLSISREITNLLGGELHVQSELGVGSTFTLYLPVERAFEGEAIATPWADLATDVRDDRSRPALHGAGDAPGSPSVLAYGVSDPTELVALAQASGFRVITTSDPDEAVDAARRYRPAGIFLVAAPGSNAPDVLVELKRRADIRHLPVYVFDADSSNRGWWTAGAAQVAGHLDADAVRDALRQIEEHATRSRNEVLVIDDDAQRRHDIVTLIGDERISVIGAGTAADAAHALANHEITCIVIDAESYVDDEVRRLVEGSEADGKSTAIVLVARDAASPEISGHVNALAADRPIRLVHTPQELFDATALFLHRPVLLRMPVPAGQNNLSEAQIDLGLQGRRILIVDDDPRNVFAISSVLEAHGMAVAFAENGADGVAALISDPAIDLVLMDIMMPGMDGYTTMEAIRHHEAFADLPIIALTAKAMVGDREKAIAAGASDYVTKPVDIDVLLRTLREWLLA